MKKIFCFGVGFSGKEILKHAKQAGFDCIGCVRDPKKARSLSSELGMDIMPFSDVDITSINPTHIIHTVPTNGEDSDCVYDTYVDDICALDSLEWFGYLSTTGVYGDTKGADVDEQSPLNPSGKRGKSRVMVEKKWQHKVPKTHIFRLPAIYGLGRSALDKVQHPNARAIYKQGQVFGRIHVYDIAQTVVASMCNPCPQSVYNVVDDMPCNGVDVLRYACDILGIEMVPVIPFEQADLSPMSRSFYRDNRRVKNTKIKIDLGVRLQYPTYKQGLQEIFRQKKLKMLAK